MVEATGNTADLVKGYVLLAELGDRQWVFPLDKDPIRVGRSPNNHLSLMESQLAPRHLKFIPLGQEIWVTDKWSPEGFYCNGRLTRESKIQPGDEVSVGKLKIYLLIQERSSILPAPEPILEIEAPEAPPMPVRPRIKKKKSSARGVLVTLLILTLAGGGFYLYQLIQQKQKEKAERALRQGYESRLQEARQFVKNREWDSARAIFAAIPRTDAEINAQIRAMENEIDDQLEAERKQEQAAVGDEYYDKFLKPVFSSSLIKSDIRWELIAWRRCDDFLEQFPKHSKAPLVQAQRTRLSGGEKVPPDPTLSEVEIEIKDLLESSNPNYALARKSVSRLIRGNLGEDADLKGRKMLEQIDKRANEYLKRRLNEAGEQWKKGDRAAAMRILDRLTREVGQEDQIKAVRDFRDSLGK